MIANRTEIKALLNISDDTWNDFIDLNIPIIEQIICDYCNDDFIDRRYDYFISNEISFVNSNNSINMTSINDKNLIVGDNIRVYKSKRNNGIFTIDTVNENNFIINSLYTINDEDAAESIYICKVDYPKPLKLTISKMINFLINDLDEAKTPGAKSEKIDDYSITYGETYQGFPMSIMKQLNVYRQLYKIDVFNYTKGW